MSHRQPLGPAVVLMCVALAAVSAPPVPGQEPEVPAPEDRIFVTDENGQYWPGCCVISVIDARNGNALEQPRDAHATMGQIAVTSDSTIALAGSGGNPRHITVANQHGANSKVWTQQFIEIRRLLRDSAIAVLPDNSAYLLNMEGGTLEMYSVADVLGRMVGEPSAVVSVGEVGEIVFSRDGGLVYALNSDGEIHVIDVSSMTVVNVIPYEPVRLTGERRLFNTYASVSPDGRYLVVNSAKGYVSVIDLADGTAVRRDTPRILTTYGVAFNYNEGPEPLLAVHGNSGVAVYRFDGIGPLELLVWATVPPQSLDNHLRIGSLAWTGRGDGLVAVINSFLEFRILDYGADPPALTKRLDFNACTAMLESTYQWIGSGKDVATIHDRPVLPTPTPTATQLTATPTATMTPVEPTATSTLPATFTAVPSATATPSATASPSATATATARPAPVYLPLALTESCRPGHKAVDVALVVDASTSMREVTSTGRSKLDAAVEAVGLFLDQLSLPNDQAAIIEFNGGVRVLQQLTGDRAALDTALGRIQVRGQTRIDLGIEAAHAELTSPRHKPINQAVMIVLTDGKANPVGPGAAVREADAAKQDRITVFTIGLGDELNVEALEQMASRPEYFYRAPDGEDLREIYETIAAEIPCPVEDFWGKR